MKNKKIPSILMIVSMIIFGTIGLFVKMIDLSSSELALYRATLATILISCYLIITKQKINLSEIKRQLPLLVISGMAIGINWVLLFTAYNYTTVSIATLSNYFAPVIVLIVSPLLFKEKITKKQILCFLMSTIGLVLLTGLGNLNNSNSHLIGIILGFGAACFYALVVIINKFIKGIDDIKRTFIQFVSAIIILLPYALIKGEFNIGNLEFNGWILLLVVGLIHTGINYCLYFASIKELPGQRTAILSYIDPLIAVLISVLILKEEITWMQIIGGLLILGFTLLNELKINTKKSNKRS